MPHGLDATLIRPRPRLLNRFGAEANWGDVLLRLTTTLFALVVLLGFVFMGLAMVHASFPALQWYGLSFVVGTTWNPSRAVYGALPLIYATVVSSTLALFIALPISIGSATFLSEFAPRYLRRLLGFLMELLAAIPSVVFGLWGIFVLVPWLRDVAEPSLAAHLGVLPLFQGPHQGFGLLAGGIVLAIMITPTITAVSCEVMRAIPNSLREGALALGATRWEAVRAVVLPQARSGLLGAAVLGLGRALGETMAITMVIGNQPTRMAMGDNSTLDASLFSPAYSMTSAIANEFTDASDNLHVASLAYLALILFVVTILLNILARALVWRVRRVGEALEEEA